jgi:type IV secretory pathway VirB10-like protein
MNKLGYQPLPVLLRAETSDGRWTSNSARILRVIATLGTLLALCGVIALCLIAFNVFPTATPPSKASVEAPPLPAATVSSAAPAKQNNETVAPLPDTNRQGAVADDHSIIDQTSVPTPNPTPTSAPLTPSAAVQSDSELLKREGPETAVKAPERHLPEALRKRLEKKRREAERKRSRLEAMDQRHAISSEAYLKGEEQYRSEIEQYRMEMNAHTEPKNEATGQN